MADFLINVTSDTGPTRCLNNGDYFSAHDDENLLTAAQRAQWLVRYGCRNGNCEACAATLLKGRVSQTETIIDAAHTEQKILLCLCRAQSDLTIAIPGNPQHGSVEQARRYYAQLKNFSEIKNSAKNNSTGETRFWQLHISLPAGRLSPIYPGQYVLLEYRERLIRAEADTVLSKGRDLYVYCNETRIEKSSALEFSNMAYLGVHCPLGYCYTASTNAVLILHDNSSPSPAEFSQAALLAKVLPNAQLLAGAQIDALSISDTFDTILACTLDRQRAENWYEHLLNRQIKFGEFRSDDNIRYRWRILRQDENAHRVVLQEGLSQQVARDQAKEFEQRGSQQLCWAEPMPFRQ